MNIFGNDFEPHKVQSAFREVKAKAFQAVARHRISPPGSRARSCLSSGLLTTLIHAPGAAAVTMMVQSLPVALLCLPCDMLRVFLLLPDTSWVSSHPGNMHVHETVILVWLVLSSRPWPTQVHLDFPR